MTQAISQLDVFAKANEWSLGAKYDSGLDGSGRSFFCYFFELEAELCTPVASTKHLLTLVPPYQSISRKPTSLTNKAMGGYTFSPKPETSEPNPTTSSLKPEAKTLTPSKDFKRLGEVVVQLHSLCGRFRGLVNIGVV